jgi:hypothetical protein
MAVAYGYHDTVTAVPYFRYPSAVCLLQPRPAQGTIFQARRWSDLSLGQSRRRRGRSTPEPQGSIRAAPARAARARPAASRTPAPELKVGGRSARCSHSSNRASTCVPHRLYSMCMALLHMNCSKIGSSCVQRHPRTSTVEILAGEHPDRAQRKCGFGLSLCTWLISSLPAAPVRTFA